MALPDYFKWEEGTAIVWGEAGATGVTKALNVDGLASGSGRMGASADLGAAWDDRFALFFIVETGTAPATGLPAELYLPCSYNNTTWGGKVTGSEGAYPTVVADNKRLLGPPAAVLVANPETNTILTMDMVIWRPRARYVAPVLINLLGVAIRDETTAIDNDTRVILVPHRFLIQDTA